MISYVHGYVHAMLDPLCENLSDIRGECCELALHNETISLTFLKDDCSWFCCDILKILTDVNWQVSETLSGLFNQ